MCNKALANHCILSTTYLNKSVLMKKRPKKCVKAITCQKFVKTKVYEIIENREDNVSLGLAVLIQLVCFFAMFTQV